MTRTIILICQRLPYCWNVVDFIWAVTSFIQDSVPSHRAKATISMTQHSRLQSCWWMVIIFFRS